MRWTALILFLTTLHAQFSLTGTALHWRPTRDGIEWAQLQDDPIYYFFSPDYPDIKSKVRNAHFKPEWGYRLEGKYSRQGYYLLGNYTRYCSCASDAIDPALNEELVVYVPSVVVGASPYTDVSGLCKAEVHLRYQQANLEVGMLLPTVRAFQVRLFGGLHYFQERDQECFDAIGLYQLWTTGESIDCEGRQKTNAWGIGPRIGLGGQLFLPWSLSIDLQGALSINIGERSAHVRTNFPRIFYTQNPNPPPFYELGVDMVYVDFHNPPTRAVVLGLDLDLALEWSYRFVTLRGGYNMVYYFNAIEREKRISASYAGANSFAEEIIDSGFSGPFIGLQLHY